MIKDIILIFAALLLSACSSAIMEDKTNFSPNTSQDAKSYLHKDLPIDTKRLNIKNAYLDRLYSIWNEENTDSFNDIFWILPSIQNAIRYNTELESLKQNPPKNEDRHYKQEYKKYKKSIASLESKVNFLLGFGENLLPNTIDDFINIIDDMNLEDFNKSLQMAIVTTSSSIRAVPSLKPRYKSKNNFPFDRWQNSFVFEGTPLLITHFSRTGRFAHVKSPFVYGWIEVKNIAFVDNSMKLKILAFKNYKIPKYDNIALKYKGMWVMDARVGQIIPYHNDRLIVFYRNKEGLADIKEVDFNPNSFSDFPLPLSTSNVANIINTMISQKYGWGGIFGNRDCSAFTRDTFGSFGIFLPRNSAAQARSGELVDLSSMKNVEKEEYIIKNAIPFFSILWIKGHVMLYIGHEKIDGVDRALVAHSAWSVTPIIGKKVETVNLGGVHITTLWVGADISGNENSIRNNLVSRIIGLTNIRVDGDLSFKN